MNKQQYLNDLLTSYPETPSLTLAKKAFKENPVWWTSLDTARNAIRYLRGNMGEHHRKASTTKGHYRPNQLPHNPIAMPNPRVQFPKPWGPVDMGQDGAWLLLYDLHIPFHDQAPIAAAVKEAKRRKVVGIILAGDAMDFYSVSVHQKDPNLVDFKQEIEDGRAALQYLRQEFPRSRIVFQDGNHEDRLWRYMAIKAPELLSLPKDCRPTPEKILNMEQYGVEHIGDKRPIRLGSLNVLHGHEYSFPISNPVNAARGLFMRAKALAVCGHFHKTSQHGEKNLEGKIVTTWSVGCACDLNPAYRPINDWNHGFAFVEVRSRDFDMHNLRYLHGRVY